MSVERDFIMIDMDCLDDNGYEEIKVIVDAVHQAYIDSTRDSFSCYNK